MDASYMRSYSPNVFPNPTDLLGWSQMTGVIQSCTITRDPAQTRQYGSIPIKMAVTGNDPFTGGYGYLAANLAPALSGQTWTISVWAKASVATTGALFIFGADTNGAVFTINDYGAGGISITTSWQRFSYSFTFSNANTRYIQFRLDGPDTGGTGVNIWWDGLQVERASSATPFNPYYFGNTIWKDVSGNNRTATLTNGPLFNSTNKGVITFDGSDDYATTGVSGIVPTSSAPYTVSVWLYRNTNNSSYRELLSQWTSANSGNSFYFGFQNSDVRFTDNWTPITVAGAGNTGVWMNLVGVYTLSNAYIYLNGSLSATKGSGFTYTGTGPLIIARQGELSSEYFDGRIANILIYNRALSAAEISQNYEMDKIRFGL
jgi:hypothetical protein